MFRNLFWLQVSQKVGKYKFGQLINDFWISDSHLKATTAVRFPKHQKIIWLSEEEHKRKTDYAFVRRVHRMRSKCIQKIKAEMKQQHTILTIKNLFSNQEKWEKNVFLVLFISYTTLRVVYGKGQEARRRIKGEKSDTNPMAITDLSAIISVLTINRGKCTYWITRESP